MNINFLKYWILLSVAFCLPTYAVNPEITLIELQGSKDLLFEQVASRRNTFEEKCFKNPKAPFSSNYIKVKIPLDLIGKDDYVLFNESKIINLNIFIPNENGYDSLNLGLNSFYKSVNGLHFYFFPISIKDENIEDNCFTFYMQTEGFNLNRRYPMYIVSHYEVYEIFFTKENIARSWTVFMAIMFCINLLLYNLFREKLFVYLSILVVAVFMYNGIRNSNIIFSLFNINSVDVSIYFRIIGLYAIFFAWQYFLKGLKVRNRFLNYYFLGLNILLFIAFLIAIFEIESLIRLIGVIALLSVGYLPIALGVIMKKGLSSYLKNLRVPLMIFVAQIIFIKLPINLGIINEYLYYMEVSYLVFSIVIIMLNAIILRYVLEQKNRKSVVMNHGNQKLAMQLHDEISPLFLAAKMEFERGNKLLSKYYVSEAEKLLVDSTSQKDVKKHWEDTFGKLFMDYDRLNIQNNFSVKDLVDYQVKSEVFNQLHIIIRELLQNTSKYANSEHVIIRSFITKEKVLIYYEDNGCGVDLNKKKDGIGLKNIKRRCAEIEAQFKIKSEVNKGFKCLIYFNLFK